MKCQPKGLAQRQGGNLGGVTQRVNISPFLGSNWVLHYNVN